MDKVSRKPASTAMRNMEKGNTCFMVVLLVNPTPLLEIIAQELERWAVAAVYLYFTATPIIDCEMIRRLEEQIVWSRQRTAVRQHVVRCFCWRHNSLIAVGVVSRGGLHNGSLSSGGVKRHVRPVIRRRGGTGSKGCGLCNAYVLLEAVQELGPEHRFELGEIGHLPTR